MQQNEHLHSRVALSRRIGLAVRTLRRIRNISQCDLAQAVGTTQAMISLIENGQRNTHINLDALVDIASALGINRLSKFIELAEDVPSPEDSISQALEFLDKQK
jgi:transcriptional regulator with XRE-family HTH domain